MTNTPHDSLGFLLIDAGRRLRRSFEARTAHGLSTAQWRLIVIVTKMGGTSQAQLADLLEIEPISVSRLVDRMEQAGWVVRRPHPNDRRIRLVYPTPQAEAVHVEMRAVADEVYEEALRGLSPGEREALLAALKTVIHNLSDPGSDAAPVAQASRGSAR